MKRWTSLGFDFKGLVLPLHLLRKSPRRSSSASVSGSFWVDVLRESPSIINTVYDTSLAVADRMN